MEQIIPINKNDVNESINSLYEIQKLVGSNNLNEKNEALNLAVKDRKAYDARSGCKNGLRK